MKFTNRLQTLVEDTCRAVIDDDHPGTVEAVNGQARRGFEGSRQAGDEGLILGAPCRQGADPHGHRCVAAVLAAEKPLPAAGTRVVCDADASVMAGEGVPRD